MTGVRHARIIMSDGVLAAYIQFAVGSGYGILFSNVTPERKIELAVSLGDLYRCHDDIKWGYYE